MEHAPQPLLAIISRWPAPAQQAVWTCRTLFLGIAKDSDLGPLGESLKWGQPAWRPRRQRTGTTLRAGWTAARPDHLSLFVDCKTDIAARMRDLYPVAFDNDGRRELRLALHGSFPEQTIAHLAEMTFAYHLRKPVAASMR